MMRIEAGVSMGGGTSRVQSACERFSCFNRGSRRAPANPPPPRAVFRACRAHAHWHSKPGPWPLEGRTPLTIRRIVTTSPHGRDRGGVPGVSVTGQSVCRRDSHGDLGSPRAF
jgi:hypothetical protein